MLEFEGEKEEGEEKGKENNKEMEENNNDEDEDEEEDEDEDLGALSEPEELTQMQRDDAQGANTDEPIAIWCGE